MCCAVVLGAWKMVMYSEWNGVLYNQFVYISLKFLVNPLISTGSRSSYCYSKDFRIPKQQNLSKVSSILFVQQFGEEHQTNLKCGKSDKP